MKNLKFLFAVTAILFSYCSFGQVSAAKDELAKAQDLARQGNKVEASRIYTDIMGKYPENRDAVQGWIMLNATSEEDGIKQLGELEKSFPQNTALMFFKAFWQTEHNQLDDALATTEKLLTLQPDSSVNWLMKGQVLESMNRPDEAMAAYEKSTILGPGNADAWQIKAGLLAKTNKLDEAISSYTKAIELAPRAGVFVYNRGCAYCRKGDQKNALEDLGKAISLDQRLKSYATKDEDYKSLWDNEDFKKLTSE
jgi:tetratricopeptide (TPR) repeat protein